MGERAMLSSIGNQPNVEIAKIVKGLLKEDADHDRRENRSVHRENMLRAVSIDVRQPKKLALQGFSRNISGAGMGLITNEQIPENSIAILSSEPLKDRPYKIMSECRWCKPYGKNWFVSGWLFRTVTR